MIEKAIRQLLPTILLIPPYESVDIDGVGSFYRFGSDELRITGNLLQGHVKGIDIINLGKSIILIAGERLTILDRIRIANKIKNVDKESLLIESIARRIEHDEKERKRSQERYDDLRKENDELKEKLRKTE